MGKALEFIEESQSPENGSQHCKRLPDLRGALGREHRRNPLKTGLSTASRVVGSVPQLRPELLVAIP